jgi:hypothetical protein
MDPGYTPDDELPVRLRQEMGLLLHLESRVSKQVERVIDVAVKEWQAVEDRAVASAAIRAREEQLAEDRAACVASIRKRKTASRSNERAADWASIVTDRAEHAADYVPLPERLGERQQIPRCPPSSTTGYTGAGIRDGARYVSRYRATCGNSYLGSYQTAEEAAGVYDRAAIEANIAAGYDKHRLNFSRSRTKRPRAPEAICTPDLHCSEGLDEDQHAPGNE